MINKDFTFIVPAAGQSKRFKYKISKIFYKYKNKILIEHIIDKCLKISKKIIIISNKENSSNLRIFLRKKKLENINILIQNKPKGMGHAVHIALKKVKTRFSAVIWADQIYLKNITITKTIKFFLKTNSLLTFPIFNKKNPYVFIKLDKKKNFLNLIQTREINKRIKKGFSDCGFFVFKTKIVREKLSIFIKEKILLTKKTKEIDFLTSFQFLKKFGIVNTVKAHSVRDTLGINKRSDLL